MSIPYEFSLVPIKLIKERDVMDGWSHRGYKTLFDTYHVGSSRLHPGRVGSQV
jgi:hypothetical protein